MQNKPLIVSLLALSIGCNDATGPNSHESTWTLVSSVQPGYFHGLHFVGRNNGWVVGDSGRILHTGDGGTSWDPQESGTAVSLKCVYFANASVGWIGAAGNSIGRTTDGGASWIWQHPAGEPRRTFMAVSFVSDKTGWIVDNYAGILHTIDGGITWVPQVSGTTWGITSVHFMDANEGWATATNRIVLHTMDGGNNWSTITLDTLDYGKKVTVVFEDIYFVNRSTGWIATLSGISDTTFHPAPIVFTTDAGNTWTCQTTPEDEFVSAVVFTNELLGWAAGYSGILHTTDGGTLWQHQFHSPGALFVGISLPEPTCCWALTFTGEVYRHDVF